MVGNDSTDGQDGFRVSIDKVFQVYIFPDLLTRTSRRDSSILPLELWDAPGTFDLDSITWEEFSSVIYMLDVSVSLSSSLLLPFNQPQVPIHLFSKKPATPSPD
jgi:hypothetical protein